MANLTKLCFIFVFLFITVNAAPQNTDAPIPPTTDDSAVTCPAENGQFKHPQYCDQFLNCWEGVGVVGKCEHGLYFNPVSSTCDYPSNVDCQGSEDSRPQMDESVCPSGYGTFENANHCGQFIICHAGSVYVFDCPTGLVYNSTLGVCVYPAPGESCLEQHQQPEPTPETPSQEGMPPAIPVFHGSGTSDVNPVLFPVIPSWPNVSTYSTLKCPEGHRMGFIPANPTYAVCVKSDSVKF